MRRSPQKRKGRLRRRRSSFIKKLKGWAFKEGNYFSVAVGMASRKLWFEEGGGETEITLSRRMSHRPGGGVGGLRRGSRKMVLEGVCHLTFPLDKIFQQRNILRGFTQLWKIGPDKELTSVNCLVPG